MHLKQRSSFHQWFLTQQEPVLMTIHTKISSINSLATIKDKKTINSGSTSTSQTKSLNSSLIPTQRNFTTGTRHLTWSSSRCHSSSSSSKTVMVTNNMDDKMRCMETTWSNSRTLSSSNNSSTHHSSSSTVAEGHHRRRTSTISST